MTPLKKANDHTTLAEDIEPKRHKQDRERTNKTNKNNYNKQ